MNDICFNKPENFTPDFTVSVEKHIEVWPSILFFLLGTLSLILGGISFSYKGILGGIILTVLFGWTLIFQIKIRKRPEIIEINKTGLWFPHWKIFAPWERCHSFEEITEKGFMASFGVVKLKRLCLEIDVKHEELLQARKRFIFPIIVSNKKSSPKKDMMRIEVGIPYTTGNGEALSISKSDLKNKIQCFIKNT